MNYLKEQFTPPEKYNYWQKQLNYLYDKFQLGKPPGVLKFLPHQGSSLCKSKTNLTIQDNVAFRPHKQGDGCMYVELRWPESDPPSITPPMFI